MAREYNKRTAMSAGTAIAVAEAPVDKGLRCHINIVNRSKKPAKVTVHIGTSTVAGAGDYIEEEAIVVRGVPLIRGPLVLKLGEKIYAKSDGASCNCVSMGEEAYSA